MRMNHATRDAIIFLVFAILIVIGLRAIFPQTATDPATANQKHAFAELGYCNASDVKPCIVSFATDTENHMLVNLITPRPTYPEFYLTIANDRIENHYECTRLKDVPTNILCTGPLMYPGEPLHFTLMASDDGRLLAEGSFNIIGLMLATPAIEPTSTEEATGTTTPETIDLFGSTPISTDSIIFDSTATAATSYPNSSYPNPSYP